jgi:AraC-like DNA-binding protein
MTDVIFSTTRSVYAKPTYRQLPVEQAVIEKIYPYQLRHTMQPTIPLPIAVRSTGHYQALRGWRDKVARKDFLQVYWGIQGKGKFLARDREYTLQPMQFFVLYPGDLHDITALTDWEYRWFTLDGQLPEPLVRSFGFPDEPIPVGPCPVELFERLWHEIEDISPEGQRTASATAYEILCLALKRDRAGGDANNKYRQCIELIKRKYANPDLNVEALASELGMHRTSLSKLFKANMTMSPVEYLSLFRIGKAVKLLQGTNLPVHEVARLAGFSCPNYLTNVIKKRTGLTPRELRETDPQFLDGRHEFPDTDA